ncbi:MAG TPA: ABC transporter permease subunit [Pseudomonadales bacterium]|nr:ABC transporter permease subunit [Pseudomonadales bacterium]
MRLNPLTVRKLRRFREIRRGYYSFVALIALLLVSFAAELLVNDRALVVRHEGAWHFPVYGDVETGDVYGLTGTEGRTPVDYQMLAERFEAAAGDDFVVMPPVPWGPYGNDVSGGIIRSEPPDASRKHYLGTDTTGRDILARLLYGFRTAMLFALAFTALTYLIGVSLGCAMGYFGGLFDLLFQRVIEIWSNIPFLYMVIIVFSVIPGTFSIAARISILLMIMVLFSWTGLTYYMRTETYKEKSRDYTAAAQVLGASTARIIFTHILPNTVSTMVTFIPFTVVSAITAITALDFLGWGLPAPTPSIGELLKQGTANLTTAPWIVTSAFVTLVSILTLVTFIGEAIREAYDPRKFTYYR